MEGMDNISEIWEAIRDTLQASVTEVTFKLWIKTIVPVAFDGNTLTLSTNEFKKRIITEKLLDDIEAAAQSVLGFKTVIKIITTEGDTTASEGLSSVKETEESVIDEFPDSPEIVKSFEPTFENFIVGSSNQFAYVAAVAVAKKPGTVHNPLFIYGGSGLGKTHLLKAIRSDIAQTHPSLKILYTNGEGYLNEMITHLSQKNMVDFKTKYRTTDILLVDDVQFIGDKTGVQEEFFYTFDALINDGKQIVLTSDRPPKDIQFLEERLRSRFIQGLLADIQPPLLETRIAIIKRKAELLNMTIPDEVITYIAENLKNNVRQIEGVVKKLYAIYSINGKPPTIGTANDVIRDVVYYAQPTEVTINNIIELVAKTFGVSPEDIHSDRKSAKISNARQIAMYIVREVTNLSLEEIGNQFGGKKHSTVLYSIESAECKMDGNPILKSTVYDLMKTIKEQDL